MRRSLNLLAIGAAVLVSSHLLIAQGPFGVPLRWIARSGNADLHRHSGHVVSEVVVGEADRNADAGRAHDVVLESAFPTQRLAARARSVTAPLVFVGATTDAALPDVDVKGKVAVQRCIRRAARSPSARARPSARASWRSAAPSPSSTSIEQAGNMHVRDFSNCGVPVLQPRHGRRPVPDERAGAREGRGRTRSARRDQPRHRNACRPERPQHDRHRARQTDDEIVIVNAHADGWFDAAGDNGDGLAVLIALARHFAKPENQPERTLLFVASGGHHGGGMNGPGNLVTMNPQLKGKAVLVLNLEHIAQLQFRNDPFRVEATEQPMGFGISNEAPAIAEVAKRGMERYGFALRPNFSNSIAGDLGGYAPLDVPRVQAIHSGPMYHTSGDTLDSISTPGLERAARFYAYFVSEIARVDRNALQTK